ncbi:cyclic-phosphate processing receiver domain-containing protein [Paracoccus sp. ME4]|uniref:cyclic-phosphate processing receiver domain-containing protein n=1 Tax=Paracoccus sp. ME4 TaxID=3138066 RepID=UPI00398BA445
MPWKLFLDDLRFPAVEDDQTVICRTSVEALVEIERRGCPVEMMLDHDLGEGDDVSKIFYNGFEDMLLDGKITLPEDFTFSVHSMNSVGGPYLAGKLTSLVDEMLRREEDDPTP